MWQLLLIAHIPSSRKVFLHIKYERTYLFKEIAPEQAGLVKGTYTCEQIILRQIILRQIIGKARELNEPRYICLVDFWKHFPVKWSQLLLEMGTPKNIVYLLQWLYEFGSAPVQVWTLEMRITLDNWTGGFVIGNLKISISRNADDKTLFASNIP